MLSVHSESPYSQWMDFLVGVSARASTDSQHGRDEAGQRCCGSRILACEQHPVADDVFIPWLGSGEKVGTSMSESSLHGPRDGFQQAQAVLFGIGEGP